MPFYSKMKQLPKVLEDIILDYAWSHHTFNLRVEMHQQLRHLHMLQEMKVFYNVFHTITMEMQANEDAPVPEPP